MSEKGLFAAICGFFKDLMSPAEATNDSATASPASSGMTGVAQYIATQDARSATGVSKYIASLDGRAMTGVAKYIANLDS